MTDQVYFGTKYGKPSGFPDLHVFVQLQREPERSRRSPASACISAAWLEDFVVDNVHEYILDSGASYHIQATQDTVDTDIRTEVDPSGGFRVDTANGPAMLDKTVESFVPALNQKLTIFLRDAECPGALSLGRLCSHHGFSFVWDSFSDIPRLWNRNGEEVPIHMRCNVPYIKNCALYSLPAAMPGPAAPGDGGLIQPAVPEGEPDADTVAVPADYVAPDVWR